MNEHPLKRSAGLRVAICAVWIAWLGQSPGATAKDVAPAGFRWQPVSAQSLGLWEGTQPVLVYNHGVVTNAGVPTDRARGTYIHPLYGLDGEVLTDDSPADHHHHHGLFWAWPHVVIDGKHYDLWTYTNIQQRFEGWLAREAGADRATLGVENGWYVGRRKVMKEEAWFRVLPATAAGRAIDCDFTWTPLERPITLAGAEEKSYGGLTLRFAPRTNTVITTPGGQDPRDLPMARLPWADLAAQFAGGARPSGAAIFIAPDHPGFPPMWLTRHYGVLCVGWPGIEAKTFPPGEPIHCRYRVWIHREVPSSEAMGSRYAAYTNAVGTGLIGPVKPAPRAVRDKALELRAELKPDRVRVFAGEELFTEYLFLSDAKYPYFFPVNGPRSGRSVTVRATEPYPHHSSLFFGCDRVNGGNYWQEALERGRIVSKGVRLAKASGRRVVIEQECRWERPGAAAPFADRRRIAITAPSSDRREIDFDITLTALDDVVIEKTNHSLFAARMAPDLAVTGGGALMDSTGGLGESGTFGRRAVWADARGRRDGAIEGLAILAAPQNRWSPPPWFTRDYGFLSPTPMEWLPEGRLTLRQGGQIPLRYRVIIHADAPSGGELAAEFARWSK